MRKRRGGLLNTAGLRGAVTASKAGNAAQASSPHAPRLRQEAACRVPASSLRAATKIREAQIREAQGSGPPLAWFDTPRPLRYASTSSIRGNSGRNRQAIPPPGVARIAPLHLGHKQRGVYPILVAQGDVHERVEQRIRQVVRTQTEVNQLRMPGVVVVLLRFNTRPGNVLDGGADAERLSCSLHHLRELKNRKLLGELIEDAKLARSRGIQTGDFHAANSIANVQEAARLTATPVDRERV